MEKTGGIYMNLLKLLSVGKGAEPAEADGGLSGRIRMRSGGFWEEKRGRNEYVCRGLRGYINKNKGVIMRNERLLIRRKRIKGFHIREEKSIRAPHLSCGRLLGDLNRFSLVPGGGVKVWKESTSILVMSKSENLETLSGYLIILIQRKYARNFCQKLNYGFDKEYQGFHLAEKGHSA